MPVIHAINNLYPGINAHLNSLLQSDGGWDSFHTTHLTYLLADLKRQLRSMGYTADLEQSLQIKRMGESPRQPESDITIYDDNPIRSAQAFSGQFGDARELVLPLPTMLGLDDDDITYYKAIGLYTATSKYQKSGDPVGWMELLSPSNKPTGRDFESYRDKREKVLQSGLVFVELDYLHQQPPTFDGIANYHKFEPDSYPYRITVIDPRPDFFKGEGRSRQFHVDEPIPALTIPLNAQDTIHFDFNVPYQTTYEQQLFGDQVDYGQLPHAFNLYSPTDQTRIANRVLAIINAHNNGNDLETVSLTVANLPLHDALSQLTTFGISATNR